MSLLFLRLLPCSFVSIVLLKRCASPRSEELERPENLEFKQCLTALSSRLSPPFQSSSFVYTLGGRQSLSDSSVPYQKCPCTHVLRTVRGIRLYPCPCFVCFCWIDKRVVSRQPQWPLCISCPRTAWGMVDCIMPCSTKYVVDRIWRTS